MKFVIDTNILLSALIKDSITREILATSGWNFYYPEIALHEVRKYKGLVLEKSGMQEQEYEELLNRLINCIILVPEESIRPYLEEADKLLGDVDKDDVVFLATTRGVENSVIWSEDTHFDKQDKVINIKTKKVIELFYSTDLNMTEQKES